MSRSPRGAMHSCPRRLARSLIRATRLGHTHHREDLTPACGRQDHTILPYAALLRLSASQGMAALSYTRPLIAHGDYPPCDCIWRQHRPRPPQLTPRTVTIATRPFRQDEMAWECRVCRSSGKEKF